LANGWAGVLRGLEDDDLRLRPLEERREVLFKLVAGAERVLFSEAIEA
jgi:ATP-dependent DNA ligase